MVASVLHHHFLLHEFQLVPPISLGDEGKEGPLCSEPWAGGANHTRQLSHDRAGAPGQEGQAASGQQGPGHGRLPPAHAFNVECGV